eukprot:TRINITY_DN12_c0_g1_i5.p1 TRINITY_DN12_c0_g1~~TRINITY_DN12_c0_g1_i5.p1  ORF type:complete len:364 (-),score=52.16 TRINITY_DN12_c0_g1_i5:2556-3647(-)
MTPAPTVDTLFKQLDKHIKAEDFTQGLVVSNKLIAICNDLDSVLAVSVRISLLLHQEKFSEVISAIKAKQLWMPFELGYSLYRLKKFDEAAQVLSAVAEPRPLKIVQLLAQTYYRCERFSECIGLYDKLLADPSVTESEYRQQLLTNLIAAHVASNSPSTPAVLPSSASYELIYNSACGEIACGNLDHAEQLLLEAARVCTSNLQAEGTLQEEIETELKPLRAQLEFVQRERVETAKRSVAPAIPHVFSDLSTLTNVAPVRRSTEKRKRRRRLPKLFDPKNPGHPPDPERWLKLQERSSYKKRGKRQAPQISGKGVQGAVNVELSQKLAAAPLPEDSATSPKPMPTSQPKSKAKAKGKKKGKW